MKKLKSLILLLGLFSAAFTQVVVDHPLKLNIPIESQEFMIVFTADQDKIDSPFLTTLGHYDKTPGLLPGNRIKQDHSINHGWTTNGTKTLGIQTLDYNGDRYDEVVVVMAAGTGFIFGFPVVSKTPLTTSLLSAEFVETGVDNVSE